MLKVIVDGSPYSVHVYGSNNKNLEDTGVLACSLPPFSPGLNPIEKVFAKN